jgi:threonine/homoserine/homoserine lactone efflux protein
MISPLIWFLMAAMFSPGPNIIMLTNSGARFGARRTWPHILGVVVGVGIIGAVSGLGIGTLILAKPTLKLALQTTSAVWILWMAYWMLVPRKTEQAAVVERPMTFVQAFLFQGVNPKIWAIALAASSGYSIGLLPAADALRLGLSFSCVNFFVCVFWTYSGAFLAGLLKNKRKWLVFRTVMAILLAFSAALVFV